MGLFVLCWNCPLFLGFVQHGVRAFGSALLVDCWMVDFHVLVVNSSGLPFGL